MAGCCWQLEQQNAEKVAGSVRDGASRDQLNISTGPEEIEETLHRQGAKVGRCTPCAPIDTVLAGSSDLQAARITFHGLPRERGTPNRLGNEYEGLWIPDSLLDVVAGHAISITVAAFGGEGQGIDLIKQTKDGFREFHSLKRQTTNSTPTQAGF